jgi:hypothetical protein
MPLLLTACLSPCENEVFSDVPSPSGKEHAIVFQIGQPRTGLETINLRPVIRQSD